MTNDAGKVYFTPAQVAERFPFGVQWVYKQIREGQTQGSALWASVPGPHCRFGGV